MAAGAVSLRKSHDIVILSFCNIIKGQTNYVVDEKVKKQVGIYLHFLFLFLGPMYGMEKMILVMWW